MQEFRSSDGRPDSGAAATGPVAAGPAASALSSQSRRPRLPFGCPVCKADGRMLPLGTKSFLLILSLMCFSYKFLEICIWK